MEVIKLSRKTSNRKDREDDQDVQLPGFRFHPTDEELVGFYLRRKVEERPISIELIKQVDIYKYDPWDLPKSSDIGDREWYFYCKRGRKYRNSIRPNRVTGSGFWKATGIDKPVYSGGSEGRQCIGLKKSLVYYRGSAGKGTKTDWMMHEFRQPASHDKITTHISVKTEINADQEAVTEVWTLCRIFQRNSSSYRKIVMSDFCQPAASRSMVFNQEVNVGSNTCSTDSSDQNTQSSYTSLTGTPIRKIDERSHTSHVKTIVNQQLQGNLSSSSSMFHQLGHINSSSSIFHQAPSVASLLSGSMCGETNEFLRHPDWEDLQSIVGASATDTSFYF